MLEITFDTSQVDRLLLAMNDGLSLKVAMGAEAANIMAERMREEINVDTGLSRDTITVDDFGDSWAIGPHSGYSGYFDQGTSGPYDIFPRNAKALRWYNEAGQPVFAKHVVHPGIEGSFYVDATLEASRDEIDAMLADALMTFFSDIP